MEGVGETCPLRRKKTNNKQNPAVNMGKLKSIYIMRVGVERQGGIMQTDVLQRRR